MKNSKKVTMGIDVSADKLDWYVYQQKSNEKQIVPNSKAGFKKLMKVIERDAITAVVLEASGGYERQVARYLELQNVKVYILNPCRIRDYAKSKGVYAKTDHIDARMIAEYGAINDLPHYQPFSKDMIRLRDLAKRYMQAQKDLIRQKNRNRLCEDLFINRLNRRLSRLHRHIMEATYEEMVHLCDASDQLRGICELICRQKGIGLKTALLLMAFLPELGQINGKKIASLAGLAPYAHDSGRIKGKRYIQGGRFNARKVLYMPVLVAIRHDADFKRIYEDRLSKGKAPKVAITSLMRKMLVRINARVRDHIRDQSIPQLID